MCVPLITEIKVFHMILGGIDKFLEQFQEIRCSEVSSGVLCSYKFLSCLVTHIAGNFQGRKLLQILWLCGYLQKLSLQNWECGVFWCRETEQSAKVFSMKIVFLPIRKFSPSKVSRYTVC